MKTPYIIIAVLVLVWLCTRKPEKAGKPASEVEDNILGGQGAIEPLEYPNLFENAGYYGSM